MPRGTSGKPCLSGDVCIDNSLACLDGTCNCRTGFKRVDGKCGNGTCFLLLIGSPIITIFGSVVVVAVAVTATTSAPT